MHTGRVGHCAICNLRYRIALCYLACMLAWVSGYAIKMLVDAGGRDAGYAEEEGAGTHVRSEPAFLFVVG